jgi:hypothetical protein
VTVTSTSGTLTGVGAFPFVAGTLSFSVTNTESENVTLGLQFDGGVTLPTLVITFSAVCDGITGFLPSAGAIACSPISDLCVAGTSQTAAPTVTSDRRCTACASGRYQPLSNQTSCLEHSAVCAPGSYQTDPPTVTSDRTCAACNGVTEFQNQAGQSSCRAVSNCTQGFQIGAPPTTTSNRVCLACPPGTIDHDLDPSTACIACSGSLQSLATFAGSHGVTGSITFSQAGVAAAVQVSISLGGLGFRAKRYAVHTNPAMPAEAACSFDVVGPVYNPTARAVPGTCSTDQRLCAVGDLSSKLGSLDGADTLDVSTGLTDASINLTGTTGIAGRALVIYDSTDQPLACATISQPSGLTYRREQGQVTCVAATACAAGQRELAPATLTSDRTCAACTVGSEYQPAANQRFCLQTTACITGERQTVVPTVTSDRQCSVITCAPLTAPAFGFISDGCNATQEFGSTCVYSCDQTRNFVLDLTGGAVAERSCGASGLYSGIAPRCKCDAALPTFDEATQSCVGSCPSNQYPRAGRCAACSAECTPGLQYQSTPCGATNRVCRACRACSGSTYASGGCLADNNTDTICSPWAVCNATIEFQLQEPNSTSNRICQRCNVCPDDHFAATGCCGSTDTVCHPLTVCTEDEYMVRAPARAAHGGWGSDRVCRVKRNCSEDELVVFDGNATHDRQCEACGACPAGQRLVAPCNRDLGQPSVCDSYTQCGPGTFELRAPSTQSDRACASCRTCSMHEYRSGGCTAALDSNCTTLTTCNPLTEWESQAPTATTDRVCSACSACTGGLTVLRACNSTANTVCAAPHEPREDACARHEVNISNARTWSCLPCASCGTGKWAPNGPNCRSSGDHRAPECVDHTACPAGTYETAAGTASSDRVCATCPDCPAGSFLVGGCNGSTVSSVCRAHTPCPFGQYEFQPGTKLYDRVCRACTACPNGLFASSPCSATSDTKCSHHQTCTSAEFVLYRGSRLDDVVCGSCPGQRLGRPVVATECAVLVPDQCGGSVPTTVAPSVPGSEFSPPSSYWLVTFTIQGDFNTVVGTTTVRIALFRAKILDRVAALLGIPASWVVLVRARAGSIVMEIGIANSTDPQGAQAAAEELLLQSKDEDFVLVFEDQELTVDPSTAQLQSVSSGGGDDTGVIVGAVVGSLVGVALLVLIVLAVLRRRNPMSVGPGRKNPVAGKKSDDDYLDVSETPVRTNPLFSEDAAEPEMVDGNPLFESQVADENRRLQREVELMKAKIAEKRGTRRQMHSKQSEQILDKAIAAKIRKDNEQLEAEIAEMKAELKRRQKESQFQMAATRQLRLKAEKAALEEEIMRMDEVSTVAAQAMQELEERQRQAEAEFKELEAKRLAEEETRKAEERKKLQEQIEALKAKLDNFS